MASPFLAVDIGNTNVVLGLFQRDRLTRHWRVATGTQKTPDEFSILLERLLEQARIPKGKIHGVIVCSVVPSVLAVWRLVLRQVLSVRPYIVGEDGAVPLKNRYQNPAQVGQDRLVNALAVYRKKGGPAIIIDFGTAITFDLLSSKGEYLGGVIAPGIEISLDALTQRAALLPRIVLETPKSIIGRDTVTSMQSGILNGFGALTDGLTAILRKEMGGRPKVYATGGAAGLVLPFCREDIQHEPHLTLEGLASLYLGLVKK